MEKSVTDIKKIRELTEYEFSVSVCKETYEKCGQDIDKTIEFLKASVSPVEKPIMTNDELSELEKYKKKAEKRANKKIKWSKRLLDSKIYYIFSALFFIIGVVMVIISVVEQSSNGIAIIVIAFVLSLTTLIVAVAFKNMTDKEYKEVSMITPCAYNDGVHEVVCPRCGGIHIGYKQKRFSKTKALLGVAITGRSYGAIFGIPTGNKNKAICSDCGYRFTVIDK